MGEALITRKGGGGNLDYSADIQDEISDYTITNVDPSKLYIISGSNVYWSDGSAYSFYRAIKNGKLLYASGAEAENTSRISLSGGTFRISTPADYMNLAVTIIG